MRTARLIESIVRQCFREGAQIILEQQRRALVGRRFGRLTIESVLRYDGKGARVICRCDCGAIVNIPLNSLKRRNVKSCGCLNRERLVDRNTIHNGTGTRLFRIWTGLRQRCHNPRSKVYKDYGGRGITVWPGWETFIPFRDWALDNGYRHDLTLDRLDNDGPYSPENCQWITVAQQNLNKRNNVLVEYDGQLIPIAEASRLSGINRQTISDRLKRGITGTDLYRATSCRKDSKG